MNRLIILSIVLAAWFDSGVTNAQCLNKLSLSNSKIVSNKIIQLDEPEQKDPFKAGCISFFLPGFAFGQLYNEQNWKFYRHIGITGGCLLLGALGVVNVGISPEGDQYTTITSENGCLEYLSVAFAGNWIWSVVDAVVSAVEINKQIELQKYRSDIMNRLKLGFNVNKNKQLKINFAFEL